MFFLLKKTWKKRVFDYVTFKKKNWKNNLLCYVPLKKKNWKNNMLCYVPLKKKILRKVCWMKSHSRRDK